MATREQIGQALKNAHAAGDIEAARKLAAAYQRVRAAPQSQQETPEGPTITGEFGRGLESLLSSARTTGAAVFGNEEEAALAGLERQRQIAEEYGEGPSFDRVKRAYEENGLLSAAGTAAGDILPAVAGQAPIWGALAAGALAGQAAIPVPILGGAIGAAAVGLPMFFGSNVERQAGTQLEEGVPVDINTGRALAAAAGQTALESAGAAATFGKGIVKSILKIADDTQLDSAAARDLTGAALAKLRGQAATPVTMGARAGAAGRGALTVAAVEMPTEMAQQVLERAQAGLDVLSPEALAEYGEAAYLAVMAGGTVGGATRVGEPGRVQRRAEGRLRGIAEEEAQDEFTALEQEIAVDGDWRNMGQPELPGLEPVRAPTTTAGEAQQDAARQYELGTEEYRTRGGEQRYARPGTLAEPTLPTVVNDLDAFNYMKEQGLTEATALETIPEDPKNTDRKMFNAIKAQMNETALVEMAAAEAARVPRAPGEAPLVIDTSKRIAEFDPAEREVLNRVVERIQSKAPAPGTQQRLPKALTNILMGEEATAAKAKEDKAAQDKADKEAQRAQAAADKEAQRAQAAADKEAIRAAAQAQKNAEAARKARLAEIAPKKVDLIGSLQARKTPIELAQDQEAEDIAKAQKRQGVRPTAPTTLTRMPDSDAGINALMQELGANKSIKMTFKKISGADLTDPAQYDKVVAALDKSAQNTSVEANRNAVVKLAERIRAQGRPQAAAAPAVVDELGGDVIDTTTQRVEGTTKDVQVPVPTKRTRAKKAVAPATTETTTIPTVAETSTPTDTAEATAEGAGAAVGNSVAESQRAVDELVTREMKAKKKPSDAWNPEEQTTEDEDGIKVSAEYRGTPLHNAFLLSRLLSNYAQQKQAVENAEPGQKRAAQSELTSIAKALQGLKVPRKALDKLDANQLRQAIDIANKNARAVLSGAGRYALENASNSPKLEGDLLAAVQAGNLKKTISLLLDKTAKRPEVQQILKRVQSLGLKTKIVEAPLGRPGEYDPVTDTITLDPELGLNEHTLIHELSHAALASRIADPSSKEAKEFDKFFQIVKNQLGGTYGGTDVQEFAAELMGNEQFATSTKAMKAPKGGTLWDRIVQTLAEFFGFRKSQSVYDAGIKYINELLNVPASAEPTLTEKLFLGSANPTSAAQALTELGLGRKKSGKKTATGLAGVLKKLSDSQVGGATLRPIMRGVFGLLRTQNIYSVLRDMGPKFQPMARAVKALGDAAEARLGYTEQRLKIFEDKYQKMLKPAKQYAVAMKRMFTMAEDAMRAGLDILDPEFKPTAQQQETYNRLQNVLNNLPAPVRGIYTTLRKDYDDSYKAARELLLEQYADNPTLRAEMRKKFEAEHPRIGYIPSMRFGDFVLEYTDKGTGRRTVAQFESASAREKAIDDLKLAEGEYEEYSRMADVTYSADKVSSTVVKQIMDSIAAKGASKGQLDAVYQVYLSTFPTESYAKRMMKFKDVAGASDDMLRAYANTMTQWVRHTASAKYLPRIEAAMKDIRSQSDVGGVTTEAIANTLAGESAAEFQRNPTFSTLVSSTTAVSYAAYILGNVSSALINLTALPIGYAQLAARYGHTVAYDTMTKAIKIATPISLKDMVGTENAWGAVPAEYKQLIQKLLDQGQLQHTQTREILEGRGKRTEESGGVMGAASQLGVDIMDYGSRPFSAAEKINRAAIAIAAYDAALKGGNNVKPMAKSAAMEYALEVVKDVNTSGTAATGPQLFQTPVGRVVGTFKGFAMNQAFIIARSAYLTFRGADPETRRLARRHVLSSLAVTTALSGVSGAAFVMPSVAVVSSLMQAMFGDDDDDYEYFNSDEWMRDITTSLEQQFRLPEDILYKGLLNGLTGLAVADRAAITENLFFREDPKLIEDIGYVRAMLIQLLGPSVGYGFSVEQGVVLANQGEWGRAMEKMLPIAVGNFFKGWRFLNDKTALTQDGEPIVENIDKFYAIMQMGGLAPAELSMRYEERQMTAEFIAETQAYKDQLLDALWAARQSGDEEAFEEAREKLVEFGRRYPGLVKPDTIRSSFNSRMVNLRDNVAGLTIPPAIRAEAIRRFRVED